MAIETSRAGQADLEAAHAASLGSRFITLGRSVWPALRRAAELSGHGVAGVAGTLAKLYAPFAPVVDWVTTSVVARFFSSSLRRRIVSANIAGLVVLLFGWLYIAQNQDGPIDAKRESLEAQGQLMAAAIVSNAKVENRDLVLDADRLSASSRAPVPFRDDGFAALEMSIGPERVSPLLSRMVEGTHNRARVYTRDGSLIVDTAKLDASTITFKPRLPVSDADEVPDAKDFSTRFTRFITRTKLDIFKDIGTANGKSYPLIRAALTGRSSAAILLNDDNEQIVAVAMPLVRMGATQGVLVLTARPGEVDKIRVKERRRIVPLVLMALIASIVVSLLMAQTIAHPMKELSAAADDVSHSINARNALPNFGDRQDEVGQLSRAFNKMTAALFRRAEASEKFAADVAHELKNPLTAARSTAESLHYAKTDEKRAELVNQINIELKRLNKLITDVSNASRMEAELALRATTPVDVEQVLRGVASAFADRTAGSGPRIELAIDPNAIGAAGVIAGHAGRIGQVFTNLIDNAVSFSPASGTVFITLRRDGEDLDLRIEDDGPGVPEEMREKIFERFYTYRPTAESSRGNNSGLGLAISQEIVRAHEGQIWAENRAEGGARFVVRLPMRTRKPARRPSLVAARRD